MYEQKYPPKAPYHNWKLVEKTGGESLEVQLRKWHEAHPHFAITQHEFRVWATNSVVVKILTLTYFDLEEAEKDIEPEFRTPRNEFYFKEIESELVSGADEEADKWYEGNNVDIISKSSAVVGNKLLTGFIYVDREESEAAYEKKKANQKEQVRRMSEKMAKQQIAKESESASSKVVPISDIKNKKKKVK